MKVCGFTFIRNAVKFDYPIVEAITSILPICDAFVVAIGNSNDQTEALILGIDSPKIKIIHTTWDDSLREGGKVLAVETNKAFDAISSEYDWCFYIQGDEVIHEKYLSNIKKGMQLHLNNRKVDGLLFKYVHFYGSYGYIGDSRKWYNHEVRIIRNDKKIRSWRDAQGFRKSGRKLNVKAINAKVFHYGWVKSPDHQQEKQKSFHKMWHSDDKVKKMTGEKDKFDYNTIDSLKEFRGSHPAVMEQRISKETWAFNFNVKQKKFALKDWLLYSFEKLTGIRPFEYRNYKRM